MPPDRHFEVWRNGVCIIVRGNADITEEQACLRDLRIFKAAHEKLIEQLDHWAYRSQLPKRIRRDLLGPIWAAGVDYRLDEAIEFISEVSLRVRPAHIIPRPKK